MKPTKHATTNFRMILPFLQAVDASPEKHRRFLSGEYMPLSLENLGYSYRGGQVYAMAHYGKQNGDLMADPDMTFSVDREAGTVEPLTWQNDYMGRFDQVYITRDGQLMYSRYLRTSLDDFLWRWLQNLRDQDFRADVFAE